jgi:hypothetical protein
MKFGFLREFHAQWTYFAIPLKICTFSALTLKYFVLTPRENSPFKLISRLRLC